MKSWYLIYSKSREEKLAQEHLERQGYETYLPLILGRIKRRGRTKKSVQPMFPRYLFIYLSDQTDDWGPIRSTIGISNLVKFGKEPAKVPENLIMQLKENECDKGFYDLPAKKFNPGDELLITEGPFAGYEATLFRQNSEDRIIVLLKIAEKYIKIDLNQEVIEKNYY